MKNYFCQQINKFDTWRKQRPILSFLLIFSICFLFVFSIMYLGLFRNDYKTLLGYYDGTDQLYPALYYYGDWLKGLFSNSWDVTYMVMGYWFGFRCYYYVRLLCSRRSVCLVSRHLAAKPNRIAL